MLFCEDLSDTIVQHLHEAAVSAQRQRSERLIKALGTFNSGGKTLKDWFIAQSTPNMYRGGRRKDAAQRNTAEEDSARFDREFGVEAENSSSSREGSLSGAGGQAHSASQIRPRHSNFASLENNQASLDRMDNQVSGVDFHSGSAQASLGEHNKPPGSLQPSTDEQTSPRPRFGGGYCQSRKFSHPGQLDIDESLTKLQKTHT
jgi:hypothetical protein